MRVYAGPQIFKIQLDMHGERILFYNEDRKIIHEVEANTMPEVCDWIKKNSTFAGPRFARKAYAFCTIEDRLLHIHAAAPEQDW